MSKSDTIALIQKMLGLNQREQAIQTYKMAHHAFPEWDLPTAFADLKGDK